MPSLRLVVGLLTLIPTVASARTWNVFADGSGDAPTIRAAMDSASAGDTTLVWAGTYLEKVSVPPGVSLIGQSGAANTVLDAGGTALGIEAQASPLIQGLTVTGVQLQACGPGYGWICAGTAMAVEGPCEIRDCVVERNSGPYAGIYAVGEVRVINTRFRENAGGTDVPGNAGVELADGTLTVEDCVFEDLLWGTCLDVRRGHAIFRNNRVRNNHPNVDAVVVTREASSVIIEDNLFDRVSEAVRIDQGGAPRVEIRRNTFVRAESHTALGPFLGTNTLVEQNVFTGAENGLWVWEGGSGVEIRCNDSWGNERNWVGVPDLTGTDGNISEPPLYCDPNADDFTVAQNSPLLPQNNSCGVPIGVFGQGCVPVAIEEVTWGRIKSRYRER